MFLKPRASAGVAEGNSTFAEVLAQLAEAHRAEVQRATDELREENAGLRAQLETLRGVARPSVRSTAPTWQPEPQALPSLETAPAPEACCTPVPSTSSPRASWEVTALRSIRKTVVRRVRTPLSSIEPKHINFLELCIAKHPGKQWGDLSNHEQVELIREALRPTHSLLDPRSTYMKCWDTIMGIALVFTSIVTPYEVVFTSNVEVHLFVLNRSMDAIFLKDLIMQFFLKIEIQRPNRGGTFLIKEPSALRMRYIKSWFLIDLLSIFPFDILLLTAMADPDGPLHRAKILRMLRLVKLARLLRILRSSRLIQRWQNAVKWQFATQKLIKFTSVLIICSHWMACVWGLVGLTLGRPLCDKDGAPLDVDPNGSIPLSEVSWVTTLYVGGKTSPDSACDHFDVYAAALHWAVMTITSIGYGDIVPVRLEEYLVAVVCMLAGGVLWAFIIGSVCSVISNGNPVEAHFEASTDLLNAALANAHVPAHERPVYREYLREAKAYHHRLHFTKVADQFSPLLRSSLLLHVSKANLQSVRYLREAPEVVLQDIASRLVPRFFARQESLAHVRGSLCMVDRGTIAHGGLILVPPAVFNEDFVISRREWQRQRQSTALTYAQVLVLSKHGMDEVLRAHPPFAAHVRKFTLRTVFCRAVVCAAQREKQLQRAGLTSQPPTLHRVLGYLGAGELGQGPAVPALGLEASEPTSCTNETVRTRI